MANKFDEIVEYYNSNKKLLQQEEERKEQLLIELQEKFDQLSWDDILTTIDVVVELDVQDDLVLSVINFVKQKNKISFKQWKVLDDHIKYVNRKNKKFKYGNQ